MRDYILFGKETQRKRNERDQQDDRDTHHDP